MSVISKIYSNDVICMYLCICIYLWGQLLFLTFTTCTGTFNSLKNHLLFYNDLVQKGIMNIYLKLQRKNVLTSLFLYMATAL